MKTITVNITDFEGTEHAVEGIVGWQLMEVIRDHNLPITAECGGACACATCHVYIDEAWLEKLPEPSSEEVMMLDDAMSPQENSRLSCQVVLKESLDGLKVTLAPNP